jgi:hypothetical protein
VLYLVFAALLWEKREYKKACAKKGHTKKEKIRKIRKSAHKPEHR